MHENSTDVFRQVEKLMRLQDRRFNGRKYVIFGDADGRGVFGTQEAEYVSDILVVESESDGFTCWNDGGFLDKWFEANASFLHANELFPDKLWDQNGKPFRIGAFLYVPYVMFDEEKGLFDGTELNIIKEFARKHNMTMQIVEVERYNWGDVYGNWTGTGLAEPLFADRADVILDALYAWDEYHKYFDFTITTSKSGTTCLVPAPELASGWMTPALSFSNEMWIVFLISAMVNIAVISIVLQLDNRTISIWKNIDKSISILVQIYLMQAFNKFRGTEMIQQILGVILITTVLLSTSYGGGLASVMTIPRYKEAIKTGFDLAKSSLQWGSVTDVWMIALETVHEEPYETLRNEFLLKSESDLRYVTNFAFFTERLRYGHVVVPDYIDRDLVFKLRAMSQDIYWAPIVLMLRKHSVLLPLMNRLIQQIDEAGLFSYWETMNIMLYSDGLLQYAVAPNQVNRDIIKLGWFHVQGAFAVLLTGSFLALIVFSFEVLKSKLKREI